MINKRQYQVTSNKPILHKKGKQWIVISLSALALAMGVGVGSTVTTHASQVSANATATKQVQKAPVAKLATNLHNQLVGNGASATPKSIGSASNSSATSKSVASSSVASQSNSSVASSSSAQSSSVSQNQSSNAPIHRGFGAERTLGATQHAYKININYEYLDDNGMNHPMSDSSSQYKEMYVNNKGQIYKTTNNNESDKGSSDDTDNDPYDTFIYPSQPSNFDINKHIRPFKGYGLNFAMSVSSDSNSESFTELYHKLPKPQPSQYGQLTIHYIDSSDNQEIKTVTQKGKVGDGTSISDSSTRIPYFYQSDGNFHPVDYNDWEKSSSLGYIPYHMVGYHQWKRVDNNGGTTIYDSDMNSDTDGNPDNFVWPKYSKKPTNIYFYYKRDIAHEQVVYFLNSPEGKVLNTIQLPDEPTGTPILNLEDYLNKYNDKYSAHFGTFHPTLNDITRYAYSQPNYNTSHSTLPIILTPKARTKSTITVHYVDNNGQQIASDTTSSNYAGSKFSNTPKNIKGFKLVNVSEDVKQYGNSNQDVTLTYDLKKYKHPNHAQGDIDVFYYHNHALKQYRDFGNYPVGTEFKLGAFRKAGFKILLGNDVDHFNNGLQKVILGSADPAKAPKKLPKVSKVIGNNTDYIKYYDGNQLVATGYDQTGQATKLDSDLLSYGSDFSKNRYDKLPSDYKISDATFTKYNNYFTMINNPNYGGTQLDIPVLRKPVTVTVHYVDENGKTIASDGKYNGLAGNPFQFNFKTIAGYGIDFSKLNQANLIKNAKYPSHDWVSTLVYKSNKPNKPVTPNKPKKPAKPQVQQASDYVIYTYNGKPITPTPAYYGKGNKKAKDKGFINFADNFGSDFINSDVNGLHKNAKLPAGYTLSKQTFSDFGSDFYNNASYQNTYGTNQYKIPVITVNTPAKPNNNGKKNPDKPQVQNGKIDVQFVEVLPNGQEKVLTPQAQTDKSDASLHLDGNTVSDDGQVGQTHDKNNVAYDFDTILSPLMPKGYTVASQLSGAGLHGQFDLIPHIISPKAKELHFETDGVGDQALEYMKTPQFIKIGVTPIINSSIQVRYLDVDANNKTVMTVPVAKGQVGQEFNLIAYEDKIPANYELYDIRNQQYYFGKKPETVDILLSEVKGRINVNYDDDDNKGNTIKQLQLTQKIGTPFNFASYLSNIPAGYEYKGIQNSSVDHFDKNDQNVDINLTEVKPPKLTISTITVDYKDGNKVLGSKQILRPVSTDFDIGEYLSNLPSGYEYQGIKNDIDHFDYNNHTVDVLVRKANPAKVAQSTITVELVNKANGQFKKLGADTENITTPFDIGHYLSNLPAGYEYAGIKGNVDSFDYNDHTVKILINKPTQPKVAQSTITVNYKDGNRVVSSTKSTKPVSTDFDASEYLSNLPSGYEYAGMRNDTDHFTYNNQTVDILVNKVNQPKVAQSTITIDYVNNGKVVSSTKDTQPVSTDFDIGNYLDVPSGYEYSGIKNSVDHFDYNNHKVDVLVNKVAPVKTSIFINYRDKKSGMIVKSTKVTEPVGTSFDTGEYLSNIPSNYEYAGLRGTTDNFGYDNQTVDIYMTKEPTIKPVQPSSAAKPKSKAQPAKPSSAKPSGNSKAPSASAKPSNKPSSAVKPAKPSSAQSKPSSAAKKPSASVKPSSAPSASGKAPSKASSAKSKPATKPSSAVKPSNNSKAPSASAKNNNSFVPVILPSSTPSTAPSSVAPSVAPSSNTSATPSAKPSNTPEKPIVVPPASSKAPTPSEKAKSSSKARHITHNSARPTKPTQSKSNKSGVAKHNETVTGSRAKNQLNYANHSLTKFRDANNNKVAQKSNDNHPTYVNGHKLPQTGEASTHAGVISLILFALASALFTLGKKAERHNK